MFIKVDDYEMLDFFEKEPVFIGEVEEAKCIYSLKDERNFSLTLTIDTYIQQIDISIRHNTNTIFSGQFNNIIEIKKSEENLLVSIENKKRLVIKKLPCIGVMMENE